MTNNLRPWNAVPYDARMKPGTRMFMDWARAATSRLAGVLEPLPAVNLETAGVAGGVALAWDEIPNAGVYLCFETDHVGEFDIPFAVVRAKGAGKNGAVRAGALDTATRFYYVQAVSPLGVLGNLAGPVEGNAASAVDLTGMNDFIMPASIQLFREDFLTGSTTGTLVGFLGAQVNASATPSFQNSTFPYTGILRTATTTNGGVFGLAFDNTAEASTDSWGLGKLWDMPGRFYYDGSFITPDNSYTGWHLIVIFRMNDSSTVDLAIGFASQGPLFTVTGSTDVFGIRQLVSEGYLSIYQHAGHGQAAQLPKKTHSLVWSDTHAPAAIVDTNWHRLDMISANGPNWSVAANTRNGNIFLRCYIDGRQLKENGTGTYLDPWVRSDAGFDADIAPLTRAMHFHAGGRKQEVGTTSRHVDFDYVAMQFTQAQPIDDGLPRWESIVPNRP